MYAREVTTVTQRFFQAAPASSRAVLNFSQTQRRREKSTKAHVSAPLSPEAVQKLLSEPTWSVASLLPNDRDVEAKGKEEDITPKRLHHLLRLSALALPADAQEEEKMLADLKGQLHFVSQVQKVDTSGVEPLQAIRDETTEAKKETTLGLDALKHALAREEVVGKFHKRIRRRDGPLDAEKAKEAEDWDVLGQAPKRVGRFFVVESNEVQG